MLCVGSRESSHMNTSDQRICFLIQSKFMKLNKEGLYLRIKNSWLTLMAKIQTK